MYFFSTPTFFSTHPSLAFQLSGFTISRSQALHATSVFHNCGSTTIHSGKSFIRPAFPRGRAPETPKENTHPSNQSPLLVTRGFIEGENGELDMTVAENCTGQGRVREKQG